MKVILLEDVKSVGKKGDVVEASEGYAKNFLFKKKLAKEATAANMNDLKLQKQHEDKVAAENLQAAKDFAAQMENEKVVVKMKAGEGGKAFGSVSSKEIAKAYSEQNGKEIDKKKLVLPDAIKNFGTYEVKVKLHPKVTGTLRVQVVEE
nr:50S ribosomal protein L9 [Lachnospiraceae bacterium]MBQ8253832.1 50S ribosomal protein L9 [Lachnospiraceae bacterium]